MLSEKEYKEAYKNELIKFDTIIKKYSSIDDKVIFRENLYDKSVSLLLANGEYINVSYNFSNMIHLLGLKTEVVKEIPDLKLKSEYKSYIVFKKVLGEGKKIKKYAEENNISPLFIFSKYIDEKLKVFDDNIALNIDNMIAVIKFDSEKTYQHKELSEKGNYFIVSKFSDDCYGLLGLIENERTNGKKYYTPLTSRMYSSYDEMITEVGKFAYKQEISIAIKIHNFDSNRDYCLFEDKKDKYTNLKELCQKWDATPSVICDCIESYNKTTKMNKLIEYTTMDIDSLTDYLLSGNEINVDNLNVLDMSERSFSTKKLIESMQNLLKAALNYQYVGESKTSQKYTDLLEEKKELENKYCNLVNERNNLLFENDSLQSKINELKETEEAYNAISEIVLKKSKEV